MGELDHKESWDWRIDDFELWCWRRLLRVPRTAKRSNQPILKEISPEYSLKGLMLKLKLRSFGHLMWRSNSLEKPLMLGKIEGKRRKGHKRMRLLDGIIDSLDISLRKLWEIVKGRKASCSSVDMTEQLKNNWYADYLWTNIHRHPHTETSLNVHRVRWFFYQFKN